MKSPKLNLFKIFKEDTATVTDLIGTTLLHIAANLNNLKWTSWLIQNDADIRLDSKLEHLILKIQLIFIQNPPF